jgi:hypothetical protein
MISGHASICLTQDATQSPMQAAAVFRSFFQTRSRTDIAAAPSSLSLVTTYSYDLAGRLTGTDYSDGTPDVGVGYDRLGRQVWMQDAVGTRVVVPCDCGDWESYVFQDGPLAGVGVAREHELGRVESVTASGPGWSSETAYGYEAAGGGRMSTITHGGRTAAYDWSTQAAGLPGKYNLSVPLLIYCLTALHFLATSPPCVSFD